MTSEQLYILVHFLLRDSDFADSDRGSNYDFPYTSSRTLNLTLYRFSLFRKVVYDFKRECPLSVSVNNDNEYVVVKFHLISSYLKIFIKENLLDRWTYRHLEPEDTPPVSVPILSDAVEKLKTNSNVFESLDGIRLAEENFWNILDVIDS